MKKILSINKIIVLLNIVFMIVEIAYAHRKFSLFFFLFVTSFSMCTSIMFSGNKYQASREFFFKSAIFNVINVYYLFSMFLGQINININIIYEIMIAVVFVMTTSFVTLVPCIVTFCIAGSRLKKT